MTRPFMMDVSVHLSTREETGPPMYIFHVRSHTYTFHSLWIIMLITGQYRCIHYSTADNVNAIKLNHFIRFICTTLQLFVSAPYQYTIGAVMLFIYYWLLHTTLILVDLPDEDFVELLEELLEVAGTHGVLLTQQREFHLTVSQTVVLKHHWIQPFTQSLKAGLTSCKRLGGGGVVFCPVIANAFKH